MYLDKFSLISMETIDYQLKDPVIDNMRNIIEEYKQNKDGKEFAKDLEKIIKDRFNITLKCNVKPASVLNAAAYIELLDVYHPLNKGLLDNYGEAAAQYLANETVKPNFKRLVAGKLDRVGGLDFKKARASGIFSQLEYRIELLTPLFKEETDFIIAIIMHELGHIWTFMEYVHHVTYKNVIVTSIVKDFLGIKEDNLRVEFISKINNIYGVKVPEELTKQSDPKAQLVVIGDIYKQMYNDFSETTYNTTSVEVLADQFASRFGLGINMIKGMSGNAFSWKGISVSILLTFVGGVIMGTLASFSAFFLIIGTIPFTFDIFLAVVAAGLMSLANITESFAGAKMKLGTSTYDTPKQRLVRVRNMMINQLKNDPKNNNAKQLIDQIDESVTYIEKADDYNGFIVKLLRWVSSDFRTQEERKIYNQLLEDLMDNTLYVSGNRFKHLLDK